MQYICLFFIFDLHIFTNSLNTLLYMKRISLFIFLLSFLSNINAQVSVFSDFENGNVEFIAYDSVLNKIIIEPSLENKINTTKCWFYFGITNYDTTQHLTIEYYYTAHVIAPKNPVYSYDKKKWFRLEANYSEIRAKNVKHKFLKDTVYFAAGYPYSYSKVLYFVDSISQNPYIDTTTLVFSENRRRVPMFVVKDTSETPTDLIWIIGRQHAFETTMNYVLEGIVNFLISDNEKAVKLRKNTIIYVVPMMDVDNVVLGASGRMQKPIDFNRDWSEKPHWNAVKMVQQKIYQTSQLYNYRLFFDVHSTFPGATKPIFGFFNEYYKGTDGYNNLRTFLKIFKKNAGYNLDEISGNMNENYADAYSCGIVDTAINVADFATTIECDWTTNHNSKSLTIMELKNVGRLIGETICDYSNKKVIKHKKSEFH